MKTIVRYGVLVGEVMLLIYLIGCATSGRKSGGKLTIPPGLDSTTVVRSAEVANSNFVSKQREEKSAQLVKMGKTELKKVDEFWQYLEQRVKKSTLSADEKEQFEREYDLGVQLLGRFKELSENGTNEKKAQEAQGYCVQAQQHLEQAVQINPFDKNARAILAVCYYNLQHRFGVEKNYEKAIEILERLTRIEKGEHELFRLLAENYLAQKDYANALLNFQRAQMVLIKTSFDAPPDSSMMFYYLYAQGDAYARLFDAERSLKAFQVAEKFARTPQEKADLKNYIKWINWDGGNIRASEVWDKILALEGAKEYDKMARASEQLLPTLKTLKARLMVAHKLAVVEFELLGKKAPAVERMRAIFEAINNGEVSAKDEEIQPFLNSYGAMLYRLGIEARDKEEKKLALAYFTKATSFEWDQIAKAYIELVTLLWNDPEQAIFYGKKALAKNAGLTPTETTELLSLMVRAHKSAGNYDEARDYFNKWKQSSAQSAATDKQHDAPSNGMK